MRVNVTHKFIIGFALMVVFIVVVGAGGLYASRTIVNQFDNVTEDVIPSLTGSLHQMVNLQEANRDLFAALSQNQVRELNKQRKAFQERVKRFQEEQLLLSEKVAEHPKFAEPLQRIDKLGNEYFALAETVLKEQKQTLVLGRRILEGEIQFQSLIDSLNAAVNEMVATSDNRTAIKAAKKFRRTVVLHRFNLTNYRRSGEMGGLETSLKHSKGNMEEAFNNAVKAGANLGRARDTMFSIQGHLYEPRGLVDFYRQQSAARAALDKNLEKINLLIVQTREAVDEFIQLNNNELAAAEATAAEQARLSLLWVAGLSLVAVACAIGIAWVLVQTIRVPLAEIHKGLKALRGGDLAIEFAEQRKDEFGDLSGYLNSVVVGLKEILQQIADGSEKLSNVAQKNVAISEQTTQSMNLQSMQLEQTSSAAVEMEHSVSEVADHSKTTLQAVHEFEGLSNDVNTQIMDTIASIEAQAKGIDQAVGVSNEMSAFGSQIGNILTSIQGIADKTNLLALNAAIEAARAGEQGRGFAVVADEVRALAARTRESVQDIQAMVSSMQESIVRVSEVMTQSYQQTQTCVDSAHRSQDVLQAMNAAVSHIRDLNAQIENAASEQASAVAEVSQTLVTINTAAAETSQGAEQASSSSHELLGVAQQQQSLLSRFSMS